MAERLDSHTYKLRPGVDDESPIYFTIVGGAEPESFFINTKRMESYQWIITTMTGFSRQIQLGATIESIIKDMKEAFDVNGSYFIPGGQKVNSIVHHLGLILERHVEMLKKAG